MHPYKNFPDKSFWSKAVSSFFDPTDLINLGETAIRKGENVTSAGSCFASNMIPYIEEAGANYLRTESLPQVFAHLGENLGYANFSARYGNIYTVRQLLQLYKRAIGIFKPTEDRWFIANTVIDPFRPGLRFPASTELEFDLIVKNHLLATKQAFEKADVFVFTLGLTEAWINKIDGSVYPACPGTISGKFDSSKYIFKNFTVSEIVADLNEFISLLRIENKKLRFILSVSPVPLVATATSNHVLSASIYSKSVLRVAAEEVSNSNKNVAYFPAYELITGPQAPVNFLENDLRNVSKAGVDFVMSALLKSMGLAKKNSALKSKIKNLKTSQNLLSNRLTVAECDEVMLDNDLI